jgi:carbon-monoxide dehydrogenase medium subunit
MKAAPFEFVRPDDAADAVRRLMATGDGAKICGGSQSLGPMLNLRLVQVEQLVGLAHITALKQAQVDGDVLRIGAAVTHARIEDGDLPDLTAGLLPAVAANIAYRAVRNRGTLGGSIAHADPAADWVSVMCLLNASIVLLGPTGERRVPAKDFFLGPFTTALASDEIVLAIELRRFSPQARWAYRKVCRKPGEFADAIGAAWTDPARGQARALIGALSGMPHVVDGIDAVAKLQDPHTGPAAIQRMLDDAGVDDAYERDVHAEMLRQALADLNQASRSSP